MSDPDYLVYPNAPDPTLVASQYHTDIVVHDGSTTKVLTVQRRSGNLVPTCKYWCQGCAQFYDTGDLLCAAHNVDPKLLARVHGQHCWALVPADFSAAFVDDTKIPAP